MNTALSDPKLLIEGREYDFPTSYDLEEARMLKKLTGLYLGDLEDGLRIDDPDYITFLVWCVLHRDNPKIGVEDVGKLELMPIIEALAKVAEEEASGTVDAGPPDVPVSASDSTSSEPSPTESSTSTSETGTGSSPETEPQLTTGSPS